MATPGSSRWAGAAVWLVPFAAYSASAAHTLQGGDSSEFTMIAANGGVPHPSGYPLYTLVVRLFGLLPFGSMPYRASLATAALGACAVFMFFRACKAWRVKDEAALLASACLALSPSMWVLSSHPEVFSLNVLAASALIWVANPQVLNNRLAWLGLVSGLGFSNHLTFGLLFPIGVLALARGLSESPRRSLDSARMMACALIGLLPYGALLWMARYPAPEAWVWNPPTTWIGLVRHALRADYGILSFAPSGAAAEPAVHLKLYAQSLVGLMLPCWIAALAGFLILARQSRASGFALLSSFLLAGPVLISRFNVPVDPIGEHISARFYLLPAGLLTFAAAFAFDALFARFLHAWKKWLVVSIVALGLGVGGAQAAYAHNRDIIDNYLRDTLNSAPKQAFLIGKGDVRVFGFTYMRTVEKVRPDVFFISSSLVNAEWYLERIQREAGVDLRPARSYEALVEILFSTGHPVLLTDYNHEVASLVERFPNYSFGTMIHLLPVGAALPTLAEIEQMNTEVYAGFSIQGTPVVANEDPYGAFVYDSYATAWRALAHDYGQAGDQVASARCTARAAQYAILPQGPAPH